MVVARPSAAALLNAAPATCSVVQRFTSASTLPYSCRSFSSTLPLAMGCPKLRWLQLISAPTEDQEWTEDREEGRSALAAGMITIMSSAAWLVGHRAVIGVAGPSQMGLPDPRNQAGD